LTVCCSGRWGEEDGRWGEEDGGGDTARKTTHRLRLSTMDNRIHIITICNKYVHFKSGPKFHKLGLKKKTESESRDQGRPQLGIDTNNQNQ
jgi:hypothetical protein